MTSRPPLHDEPLPVELANTRYARHGRERDGLARPEDLADWLARVAERLPPGSDKAAVERVTRAEVAAARALRDALRGLFAAQAAESELDVGAVEVVNRTARAAPAWPELQAREHVGAPSKPLVLRRTKARPVAATLGAIAAEAVLMLAGGTPVRPCAAPDCTLFYRKDHPRQSFCSVRCNDRHRAARHYARRALSGGAHVED